MDVEPSTNDVLISIALVGFVCEVLSRLVEFVVDFFFHAFKVSDQGFRVKGILLNAPFFIVFFLPLGKPFDGVTATKPTHI